MGGLLRTLESEIGLYETDYIFVSSGYPPRVEGRMDQLWFFTQSIAGFDWVCIRPWSSTRPSHNTKNHVLSLSEISDRKKALFGHISHTR